MSCFSSVDSSIEIHGHFIIVDFQLFYGNWLNKSLVRPHLEYCSPAWSPKYVKDKELLERIQHRFTRFFNDLRDLDYAERLRRLGLWSLEERRNRADLIEVYKTVNGRYV